MATEKIFLSVLLSLFLIIPSKSKNEQGKYSETSYNFLDTNINIREVIDYTLLLLPGEVTKVEKKFKKDIPIWKINMITSTGGSIEVELSCKDKKLLNLEADEGPFDYEIIPDNGMVSFTAAKKTAEEYTSQNILKWCLKQNRDKMEYNFWLFTKTGKAQVKVDAESGDIVTKTKKKK
ncbi:MAG: PepSY domain-containing protein [Ignavibacteria bacterium]